MSKSVFTIDSHDLARVIGGVITGSRDPRQGARILDALTPDTLQVGPFGWNLPEKPFTNMLDHFGVPQSQPAQPATTNPSMNDRIKQATANSLA